MQEIGSYAIDAFAQRAGFINNAIDNRIVLYSTNKFAIAKIRTNSQLSYKTKAGNDEIMEFIIPNTSVPYLSGDGAVYYSEVNTVYNVSPSRPFNIQSKASETFFTDIIINKAMFNEIMQSKCCSSASLVSPFYASASLSAFIELFISEYSKENRDNENVLEPLGKIITAGIIDSAVQNNASDERTTSYFKGIRVATEYINANFDKQLSIEELADVCGLSYSYFSNCFKRTFGDTPKGYITNLRINKAKYYLTETVIPIKDISSKCGFSHFNTFTSAFKKYVGISPREYRNKKRIAAVTA